MTAQFLHPALSSCTEQISSHKLSPLKLERDNFPFQIILPDSSAFKTYKISSGKSLLWNVIRLLSITWLQVNNIRQATQPWRNSRSLPKRIPVTDKKWEVFLAICRSKPGYFSLPKAQSCMIMREKKTNPLQSNQCANPGLPQQVNTPGRVWNSQTRLYISHFCRIFWTSKNEVMD